MAFRYLIYSTGTTYADTILRESTSSGTTSGEAFLFSDFVIPEIQPLYLWRVTGGTDVVPNTDSNITNYLNETNPPSPDDPVTYGVFTGYTAQTQTDLDGKVDYTIFNAYTAQTQTDLDGKIDIVTGATGNLGEFDSSGNLVDTGWQISGLTGTTGDIYVSGMTYIGSTLTLERTEGLPDLFVTITASGTTDGVVSGGTLSGTILSLQRTEGLPDVDIELSGLTAGLESDIIYLSGVTSGNTVDIATNAADIAYISGITDTKLDTAIFNTYTGDTRTELDLTLTGATNGLTKSGRDVLLGGALTQNTSITGAGTFDLGLTSLNAFNLGFDSVSTITDSGNNGGLRYAADYSGDYVDRSLVDKAYVDALASGLDWKNASIVATASGDTDLDLTGGTFAGTIDGRTLVDGDRVLIKNQDSNPEQNGIYDYSASTSGFTRSEDFDGTPAGEVTQGAVTHIISGDTNANTAWVLTTPDPITVGTTPLQFVLFGAGVSYVAGVGIDISGNVISFDGASVAGDFMQWTGTQLNVTGVTSQSDFNSYTAATQNTLTQIQNDITYISGITDQNTSGITYISGITDSNTTRIENLESSVSGLTGQTFVTEDTFTGYTASTDVRLDGIDSDIQFLSAETSGNTAAIAAVSAETANKLDKVSGATDNNLPIFALSGDSLVDSGIPISAVTGTSEVSMIQLVSTGTTEVNTITATSLTWDVIDYSSSTFNYSGGSGVFILEAGDYEVSYSLTVTQDGGGQDRSIGSYLVLNNADTLDRTSSAGSTSGNNFTEGLAIPPTRFTFAENDRLDLAAFRIGGTGSVLTNPYEVVLIIKKAAPLA